MMTFDEFVDDVLPVALLSVPFLRHYTGGLTADSLADAHDYWHRRLESHDAEDVQAALETLTAKEQAKLTTENWPIILADKAKAVAERRAGRESESRRRQERADKPEPETCTAAPESWHDDLKRLVRLREERPDEYAARVGRLQRWNTKLKADTSDGRYVEQNVWILDGLGEEPEGKMSADGRRYWASHSTRRGSVGQAIDRGLE